MSTIEIVSKIEALKEWEALAEEAAAEIESLRDDIKKEMDGRGVEVIEAGQYIARFTTVQSNRFDTKRFKMSWARMFTSGSARKRSAAALPLAAKERAHT